MHAVVAEIFAHGAAAERRQVLHRCWIGSSGGDNNGIVERALLLEHLHELGDGRALLPNGDIDAVELDFFIRLRVERFLIEDGVERDSRLSGLTIADDQLALTTADRDQRVDRLEAGRHRLMHRLPWNNARCFDVDACTFVRLDRALSIDRITKSINHASKQTFADGHVDDGASALYGLTFLDLAVIAENHDADIVIFEVEGNAVTDGEYLPDLGDFGLLAEVLDLLFQNGGDFCGADIHQRASFIANLIELSLVRSELSTIRLPTLTISPPIMAGSTSTSRS